MALPALVLVFERALPVFIGDRERVTPTLVLRRFGRRVHVTHTRHPSREILEGLFFDVVRCRLDGLEHACDREIALAPRLELFGMLPVNAHDDSDLAVRYGARGDAGHDVARERLEIPLERLEREPGPVPAAFGHGRTGQMRIPYDFRHRATS